jgi:hypothetical protein
MDTKDFLNTVLPRRGHYVLAVLDSRDTKNNRVPVKHKVVATIDEMVTLIYKFDSVSTKQVYHACATYKEPYVEVMRKGKMVRAIRIAKNAGWVRTQWLDIDVGDDKTYKTVVEALAAVKTLCQILNIPSPLIVRSGKGLHCYWVFSDDVSTVEHYPYAEAFKVALVDAGFDADDSRTSDMASILRPVGSHHKKGEPVEVVVYREQQKAIPYSWWKSQLSGRLTDGALLLTGTPPAIPGLVNNWSSRTGFDDAKVEPIARNCGAIANYIKRNGDVSRAYWRAALGIFKHTEEGAKAAHKFSKGHPDYAYSDTQHELEGWEGGPALCKTFRGECPEICGKCKHNGKITSPIVLGMTRPSVAATAPKALVLASYEDYARVIPDAENRSTLPFYPHAKYKWESGWVWVFDYASAKAKEDADDKQWLPFSRTLYYPYMRFRNDDGTYGLKMCVHTTNGKWRTFDMDTKYVGASTAEFGKVLSNNEVTVVDQERKNRHYVNDVLRGLQDYEVIAPNYDCFGWHHNSVEEDCEGLGDGFVIGRVRLTGTKEVPVMLSKNIPDKISAGMKVRGSAGNWTELVDQIYNRRGAEAYQFCIMAAIAAPLVAMVGIDAWRGIPIALTGASGLGKTTTCKVGASFYGSPDALTVSANKGGSTLVGLLGRIAMHQHLPIVFDELTGADTATAQQLLYSVAHGEPKIRGNVDGSERINNKRWATVSFVTSNDSVASLLTRNSDTSAAEATQVRCFEIALPEDYNKVFGSLDAKRVIEHDLLSENYGAAGREFLQYIVANRDAVSSQCRKDRIRLAEKLKGRTNSKERFYVDLIAVTRRAGLIAKRLGLLTFDVDEVTKWAVQHIYDMREMRTASLNTPEDYLQAYLGSINNQTIRTKNFVDGRSKVKAEYVDERVREPVARIATEDKVFIATKHSFTHWCRENQVDDTRMLSDWINCGFVRQHGRDDRERITKGTNLPGVTARCVRFDYDVVVSNSPAHLRPVDASHQASS